MLKRISFVVSILTVLCLMVGCGKKEPDIIKVGAVFDLTGSLSYMGKWSNEGAQIAVEELNKQILEKGKKIELIVEDGETKPEKAVSAFKKLIDLDKVSIVIGFNASSEVMAAAPIANQRKVILFSTGGASPAITTAGDYVFRNRLSGKLEVEAMATIAIEKLKLKALGILYINNDYGKGYKDVFQQTFERSGGRVVFVETFDQDKSDFRNQIAKIRNLKGIQGIYLIPYVKEGGYILKQAKELDLKTIWLSANAIEGPELFDIAGDAAEGLMYTVAAYNPEDSLASGFNGKYKTKFGYDSEMFAANAYDGLGIAVNGILKVGNDGEKLKEYLYSLKDYRGPSGLTSFDQNGDVIKQVMIKIVKNRKFVPYQF